MPSLVPTAWGKLYLQTTRLRVLPVRYKKYFVPNALFDLVDGGEFAP